MPGISRPGAETHPFPCPHCGTINDVTKEQVLCGFRCSACGGKVSGIGGNPGVPVKITQIVCPECKSGRIRLRRDEETEKIIRRCEDCGTEW